MIKDMIEFGKWLDENNLDDFGEIINDDDYILPIFFNDKPNEIGEILLYEDYGNYFFKNSIFSKGIKKIRDQKFKIPSNSNLSGTSPFIIEIPYKHFKEGDLEKINKEDKKFKNKFEKSKKANEGGNEFIKFINIIYKDTDRFLESIGIDDNQKKHLKKFFSKFKVVDVNNRINDYYTFLFNQREIILEKLKSNEIKIKKVYLISYFQTEFDLLNDIFYYYSKFIKKRKESFNDYEEGICSFCNNQGIVYPTISSYSIGKPSYSFNYDGDNKKTAVKNSKFKSCKKCETYVKFAENKIKNILNNNYNLMIIPIKTTGNYADFLKISNEKISSFDKINKFMSEINGFNYDLIVYTTVKQGIVIEKYIENYKSYLVKFEGIHLYNDKLNYLLDYPYKKGEKEKSKIENIFDIEHIFKSFFVDIDNDGKFKFPNFRYFYEIYTKDFRGKTGIFNGFDNRLTSTFSKYMHSIFNLIYKLNENALNKNMLNEMVFNSIIKLQNHDKKLDILKRLNYYFMLKKELLGGNIMEIDNVERLKESLKEGSTDFDELIEKEPALKYYLLGQFLRYIDNFKRANNKKMDVFSNFINNVNRNNVRDLFVTEVLQKNNYYIDQMSEKGKLIFKLFKNNRPYVFNEPQGFSYEDYILLMFTGYYTENILKSDKKKEYGAND
ncbi:MAG: hypothetical protein LBR15_10825 [Methanobrevibacter sp.]|jgi:CRISPR-associated protein Csh1|nr:hypothetical protein [Candidatus Methanovirga australis]